MANKTAVSKLQPLPFARTDSGSMGGESIISMLSELVYMCKRMYIHGGLRRGVCERDGDTMSIRNQEIEYKRPRLPVHCANGLRLSIQAGKGLYSSPHGENRGPYTAVEIGYPSREIPALMPYAEEPCNPTGSVYIRVPASLVLTILRENGGAIQGEIPPLANGLEYLPEW